MNDSEYAARWRILDAQLSELERNAGVGDLAARLRKRISPAPLAEHEPNDDSTGLEPLYDRAGLLLDAGKRRDLRALYFGVAQPALRKLLIAKQRELALFERTRVRVRLEDARRHLESMRRRPSEGWWIAAIVGAALVIVGYWLFTVAGAIAAGVAALFVGNGIEQAARRRFEQAIAFAEEDVSDAGAALAVVEQYGDLFTEREGAAGEADRALQPVDDLSAKTM